MRWREVSLYFLVLSLTTLAVYSVSFPAEFHYDDFSLMLDNPRVTGPSFPLSLFVDQYGGRPLTIWSFFVNYKAAGDNVWTYQVINLLLHVLASCLFFVVARRALSVHAADRVDGGSSGHFSVNLGALFGALIFALHPLQTQAVNYIWSRSVLLMTCFGLAAILLVGRSAWLALLLFQLAVLSRTEALILAVPLLALKPKAWKWLVPLSAANLMLFLRSVSVYAPREVAWNHSDAFSYWIAQPFVVFKYLFLMFWPQGLTVDHELTVVAWKAVIAGVALPALAVAIFLARRRMPALAIGFGWLILALLPSAVIPNTDLLNESRAYPAMAGFALALGGLWLTAYSVISPRQKRVALVGAALVVLILVPLTAQRNRVWRTDVSLWKDAVAKSPGKGRAHYNLGSALARAGDVRGACNHFARARDLDPSDDYSHAGLGYCFEQAQELREAVQCYRKAISLNPNNEYAREGLERIRRRVELERPGEEL